MISCWAFGLRPEAHSLALASCPGGHNSSQTTYLPNTNTWIQIVIWNVVITHKTWELPPIQAWSYDFPQGQLVHWVQWWLSRPIWQHSTPTPTPTHTTPCPWLHGILWWTLYRHPVQSLPQSNCLSIFVDKETEALGCELSNKMPRVGYFPHQGFSPMKLGLQIAEAQCNSIYPIEEIRIPNRWLEHGLHGMGNLFIHFLHSVFSW